jgi:DNA invertase Pin-like site-specific DNA recombinase
MRVLYSRVSTLDQNPDRQLQDKNYDYIFTDYCSGSIPLFERPKGSQVKKLIDQGLLKELHIHSIDRLGRNTLDVLSVWEELTKKGIVIICKNPSIRNIDENGKVDKFSELTMSILSLMATFTKRLQKESQMEGIRLRRSQNLYTGRRVGTSDTPERLLSKDRSKRILDYLSKGTYSYHEISKIVGCSPTTIVKVKKMSQMVSN